MLFIGDYSDEGGWRGIHFDLETGLILEIDREGDVVIDRQPTQHELLLATLEWANANQDSPFPSSLYCAIKQVM